MSCLRCLEGAALLMIAALAAFWIGPGLPGGLAPPARLTEHAPVDRQSAGGDSFPPQLVRTPLTRTAPPRPGFAQQQETLVLRSDRFAALAADAFGDRLSDAAAAAFIPTLERLAQHEDDEVAARARAALWKIRWAGDRAPRAR